MQHHLSAKDVALSDPQAWPPWSFAKNGKLVIEEECLLFTVRERIVSIFIQRSVQVSSFNPGEK